MQVFTILLAAIALIAAGRWPERASCSSYLDDYFLPTAKLALNKLQQSLTPSAQPGETPAPVNDSVVTKVLSEQPGSNNEVAPAATEATATSTTTVAATSSSSSSPPSNEPSRQASSEAARDERQPSESEFVKIQTVNGNQPAIESNAIADNNSQREQATEDASSLATITVSSTQATNTDPTTTTANEQVNGDGASAPVISMAADSSARQESNSITAADDGAPIIIVSDSQQQQPQPQQPAPEAGTSPPPAAGSGPGPKAAKSLEEAAREAEAEAVAAVDASIGFGADPFGSLGDSCYDEYGNPRYCEPEFENVALEREVEVSSECGRPASRFCTGQLSSKRSDQNVRNCHICDAQHPKKRHPAAYLTDMNNSNNPTCWVSAPIQVSSSPQMNQTMSRENQPLRADNVTLRLNLDKKYDITYISMQFCSLKPDSLAIHKSADFGATWTPYQFYSSQCRQMYGLQAGGKLAAPQHQLGGHDAHQPIEATCLDQSSASSGGAASRVAFSTLDGRGGMGPQLDRSSQSHEWTTATNIKIILDRHQTSWIQANQLAHHAAKQTNSSAQLADQQQQQQQPDELESSLINPSDTYNYAISDLTVGGRCKCNGHASKCVHGRDGQLQCDCRHNTAGRDCERCAPFHFDRPWARANQLDANPCQPCNCNGHSRKCRFDSELYQLSGKRSGGVCIQCRHNTDGRHCHYCKEGFTRDHSKPLSDKEVCKPCNCHPVGSRGRVCDQTSGQCPCKEGVTGLECNRCAAGYQQSSSPSEPCIKLPENDINSLEPSLAVESDDQPGLVVAQDQQHGGQAPELPQPHQPGRQAHDSGHAARWPKTKLASSQQDGGGDEALDSMDKQSDESDLEDQFVGSLSRKQQQQFLKHWSRQQIPGPYNKYHQPKHHRINSQPMGGVDVDGAEDGGDGDAELGPRFYDDEYPAPQYQAGRNKYKIHRDEHLQRFPARNNARRLRPQPAMASLDHSDLDELGALDELSGGPPDNALDRMYNEDKFNQIQPEGSSRRAPSRHSVLQSSRHRFESRLTGNELSVPNPNEVSCGDCQLSTRRLGLRQFCHLDYAIKGTILSRQAADDWTKVEVEIQDIFKSPASSAVASARASDVATGFLDNTLQSDEPSASEGDQRASVATGQVSGAQDEQEAKAMQKVPRFKVGTIQTIWVPTEDFSCKCPRLKTRSTYLLMGSVDKRENSMNAIQLDRHGVAFEWKPSLQSKMIKYQRRHARGRCN